MPFLSYNIAPSTIITELKGKLRRVYVLRTYNNHIVTHLKSFGRRRYAVVGPSTWNLQSDSLRDPALSLNMFKRQLKTYFFLQNIDEMYSAY